MLINDWVVDGLSSRLMGANVYLTGSRFFGTNHKNSDWDFMILATPAVQNQLSNLGFKQLPNPYADVAVTVVYAQENIHIQLIKNELFLKAKIRAQNSLNTDSGRILLGLLGKPQRKYLWNVLTNLSMTDNPKGLKA